VAVKVSDSNNPAHAAEGAGSYSIPAAPIAACVRSAPTIVLAPSSQSGAASQTLDYGLSVTSMDSSSCSSSNFNISAIVPAGWTGTASSTTLTLAPGQQASTNLRITSAATAVPGNFAFSANVANSAGSSYSTSNSGQYVIAATADNSPPTSPEPVTATLQRRQINVSWKASTDNVAVTGYVLWRNGTKIGNLTKTSYADKSVSVGQTYSYAVSAYDAAGNLSNQSVSPTVTVK
jgi:hypothetical protein